jgi:branched-chain amino acid transport system permease protein
VEIIPGVPYPAFRLAIIAVGLAVACFLYLLITRTRTGMLIRAGASNREMLGALGVDVKRLYTLVFGLGAALAALAGAMAGPILAVQVGMGESVLILTFVVIVIGGLGSVRGALVGAMLVGMVDTLARALLPTVLRTMMPPSQADGMGASLASMTIYILMAGVLAWKPRGLFPAHA